MKKSINLLLFLTMCSGGSEQTQTETTPQAEDIGEVINHMSLVDYPAKLYVAGAIATEGHRRVEGALSIIEAILG